MAAGKKGKAKTVDEAEKERLEEEARLRELELEEERQRKIEERKQRLKDLEVGYKETRYATEERLASIFNQSLEIEEAEKAARKKVDAWDQWMDQSGKPDCNSAPAISTFVSKCLDSDVTKENIFEERHLVASLIEELKHLSLDYPEKREMYLDAISKLNDMQEERLDQLTLNYMLNPKSHIDAESEDLLYETEDEISGLVYLMWGNFGKNPRRREVDWPQHKLKVELKKEQAIEDVALRIIYNEHDTLSFQLPSASIVDPMPMPEEDAEPEPEPEVEENGENPENLEGVELAEPVKASSVTESQKKEPSVVPSQNQPDDISQAAVDEEEESVAAAPERMNLDGKEGVGGVWHIEYLSLPPLPKEKKKWTMTPVYGDELKRATVNSKEAFNVALPLKDHPIASPLTVGRWDNENEKWTQDGIDISEEKDGSIFFSTGKLGSFRLFIDRHTWDGPLIDNWMIRPKDENIEFVIAFQNFKVQFDILKSGKVSLVESTEKKFFEEGKELTELDVDALTSILEERGLFAFPNEESLVYLEKLEKDQIVCAKAYSNIAAISHLKRTTSSSFNPSLSESQIAITVESDTVLCTSDRFYVIEDKYIPPEPPKAPQPEPEEEEVTPEIQEAYEEEKIRYEEMIAKEEEEFSPDFDFPRVNCPMLATLPEIVQSEPRISQQNLALYKLLKKSMVLEL